MSYAPSGAPLGIPRGRDPAPQARNPTTDGEKEEARISRAIYPSDSNAWGDGRNWSQWTAVGRGQYPEEEDRKEIRQQKEEKEETAETSGRNRKVVDGVFARSVGFAIVVIARRTVRY